MQGPSGVLFVIAQTYAEGAIRRHYILSLEMFQKSNAINQKFKQRLFKIIKDYGVKCSLFYYSVYLPKNGMPSHKKISRHAKWQYCRSGNIRVCKFSIIFFILGLFTKIRILIFFIFG